MLFMIDDGTSRKAFGGQSQAEVLYFLAFLIKAPSSSLFFLARRCVPSCTHRHQALSFDCVIMHCFSSRTAGTRWWQWRNLWSGAFLTHRLGRKQVTGVRQGISYAVLHHSCSGTKVET